MSVPSKESFTFTVGKLDAGMAILLGERAHLIEFPSVLLPPGATAGSIVNISVNRDHEEEEKRDRAFWDLQNDILEKYGRQMPEAPKLELRNVTQTSVTLEWPPLDLATAKLRSLDIYRNGSRLATIPAPLQNTSTKLSGLDLDAEYTFQLVLRTTAGTLPSNTIAVRTHTMTDTSGIAVCFGNVQDGVALERAKLTLREMNAKWSDKIEIDTTHFVCTTPAATPAGAKAVGNAGTAPGVEYQRALQLSIPVVQPSWILACHAERRMVPIAAHYLGLNPNTPMSAPPFQRPQSLSQVSLPRSPTQGAGPASPDKRASMPPMARAESAAEAPAPAPALEPTPEEGGGGDSAKSDSPARAPPTEPIDTAVADEETTGEHLETPQSARRKGSMDKNFRFPSPGPPSPNTPRLPMTPSNVDDAVSPRTVVPPEPPLPAAEPAPAPPAEAPAPKAARVVAPSSIDVPPPPPVEKERKNTGPADEADEDIGATEDIPL